MGQPESTIDIGGEDRPPRLLTNVLDRLTSLTTGAAGGINDDIEPVDEAERQRIAEIPFDEATYYEAIGSTSHGEPGYSALERLWIRPTLEINGMWGGYTGEGAKTVTPAEAFAKLTTRLVTGQDPDTVGAALEAHLRAQCPAGVELTVRENHAGTAAYTVPPEHPLLLAAEAAIHQALGTAPVRVRIGGTLPLSDIVKRGLGLDTVMLSFSTADEDFHAPNEFFRLSAIDDGVAAWVHVMRVLGKQTPEDYAPFRQVPAELGR